MIQCQQNLVSPNIIALNQNLDQNYPFNSIQTIDQFALDNYLNPKNINHFQTNLKFDQYIQKPNKIVSNPRKMSYLSQTNIIKSFKEKMKSYEQILEKKSFLQAKTLKDKEKQFSNKKILSLQKLQETSLQSQNSENSYKKEMIYMIKRPSKLIGLQLIKYSGILALVSMIGMNIIHFIQTNNNLLQQREEYQNFDWSFNIKKSQQLILQYQSILQLYQDSVFDGQESNTGRDLNNDIFSSQIQIYNNYKNLIIQTYQANFTFTNSIYSEVEHQYLNFTFVYTFRKNQVSYQSFQYILKILLAFQYKVAYQLDYNFKDEFQILFNYQQVIDQFDQIDLNAMISIKSKYQDIKQQANVYLALNIFFSVVFSLSFIPIFIYIQRLRQRILALMATFTPEKLQKMLKSVSDSQDTIKKELLREQQGILSQQYNEGYLNLDSQKDRIKSSFASSSCIQTIQKNKSLSSTSKLNLFSFKICFFAFTYLLCNVIYSATIGIYQSYFLEAIEKNIEFQSNFFQQNKIYFQIFLQMLILKFTFNIISINKEYS
ncbi:transmembrane protein, putative (macronuclear) [Tetrahymena thermophila SB210]|uniref:Transmembrane protein, putative n=1 Tax=Tetrahymena thermophila (strain SB210) TaxID=312017 RepID=I7LTX4_TETTS|nr:transmembrane protein, putative [Tetrahymena thermophila SB210]EAR87470.2 transmembrane protein, putative [Tetrahymena thermophila SB210]|eukprot:XP_001007715.2 transmembrane protein, putative [Tetrahymena thermophila SB210]